MLQLYTTQNENIMDETKTYDSYRYVNPPLKTKKAIAVQESFVCWARIYIPQRREAIFSKPYMREWHVVSPVNIIEVP